MQSAIRFQKLPLVSLFGEKKPGEMLSTIRFEKLKLDRKLSILSLFGQIRFENLNSTENNPKLSNVIIWEKYANQV